jgi:hypothetical protein
VTVEPPLGHESEAGPARAPEALLALARFPLLLTSEMSGWF